MVVLARLIPPAAFGVFAVVLIVQELALALPMEGIGSALVQRRSIGPRHLEAGLCLSLVVGVALAAVTLVAAARDRGPVFGAETAHLVALATPWFSDRRGLRTADRGPAPAARLRPPEPRRADDDLDPRGGLDRLRRRREWMRGAGTRQPRRHDRGARARARASPPLRARAGTPARCATYCPTAARPRSPASPGRASGTATTRSSPPGSGTPRPASTTAPTSSPSSTRRRSAW